MDEYDVRELERVASNKMVRCVRNRRADPTPPLRPPRKTTTQQPVVVSPSQQSSSGYLYEPLENQEQGQEDEARGEPEVRSRGPRDIPNTQGEEGIEEQDGSVKVEDISVRSTMSGPSTSHKRGRRLTPGTILKTQSEKAPQSESLEEDAKERPAKRSKTIVSAKEPVLETHQPPPNDEWGVDMDEAVDIFNMDVGEFGVDEPNDTLGQSSTWPKKSQTYVHMTDNVVHIKTLIAKKENIQGP